jgi:hypothetical protein
MFALPCKHRWNKGRFSFIEVKKNTSENYFLFQMPPQNASDRSANQFSSSNQTNLYSELERRRTFVDWPVPFLPAASLASAGFYYLRIEDVVKCIFCGIEVGKWEPGDVPLKDHQKWSPTCKFVKNCAFENIPINESDNQNSDSGKAVINCML